MKIRIKAKKPPAACIFSCAYYTMGFWQIDERMAVKGTPEDTSGQEGTPADIFL